jgi:diacylglycerol O-acyltransferase/trehalose O-mycolyltransferase
MYSARCWTRTSVRSGLGRRVLTGAVGLVLAFTVTGTSFAGTPFAGTPAAGTSFEAADDGAYIVSEHWFDSRMLDMKIGSPAVGAVVPVRVLLPAGWSRDATRTWPVLYLLQGAHDDYTAWTRETDVESVTADKDLIVAMPSAGPTGIPTRWLNGGASGPDYETFQVTELMQLLQRDYRAGVARAVAGVSTGGYGAMAMAAHHPGTFNAAASYSGVLNTTAPGMPAVMDAIVAREGVNPTALWGDPVTDAGVWNADDPYALATNLRWTALFLSCGSGLAAGSPDDLLGASLESTLWPQNRAFAARLKLLGIPVEADFYAGGVHDWPAWRREFTKSWPLLAASLGLPS